MNMTIGEFERIMMDDLDAYCSNQSLCSVCMFFNADETHCFHSGNYDMDDLFDWYSQLLEECPSACSIPANEFFKMAAPLTGTDVTVTNYEDLVNHPIHYTHGGIECVDAMKAAFGSDELKVYCKIAAFKYLWRADHKGGSQDIQKANWYLNKYLELERLENE